MAQYVIGVDFGSLSGRAVLVDSRTGQIAAQVGQTPQSWNGNVFSLIKSLSDTVMVPIAIWTYWKRRCRRC